MKIFFLAIVIAISINCSAQISSAQNGPWNIASTWIGGVVPSLTDEVIIDHVVISPFPTDHQADILINGSGVISGMSTDFTLSSATLTNNGSVSLGTFNLNNGTYHQVNGGGSMNFLNSNGGKVIIAGGFMFFTGDIYIDSDTMFVVGGDLDLDGELHLINGSLQYTSGQFSTSVTTVLEVTNNVEVNSKIENAFNTMSFSSYVTLEGPGRLDIINSEMFILGDLTVDSGFTVEADNATITAFNMNLVDGNCNAFNNSTLDIDTIYNSGTINITNSNVSSGTAYVREIYNTGIINVDSNSKLKFIYINNDSVINLSSSSNLEGIFSNSIDNYGQLNLSGASNITNLHDFYNNGLVLGSGLNNTIDIYQSSTNDVAGLIDGELDICDHSLVGFTVLDINVGTVDSVTVTFCNEFAGTGGVAMAVSIIVYPSPTKGMVFLSEFVKELHVYNSQGVLIKTDNNVDKIDLSDCSAGVYVVCFGNQYRRIIKA